MRKYDKVLTQHIAEAKCSLSASGDDNLRLSQTGWLFLFPFHIE